MNTSDVLIIGAGVVGCAAAYYLRKNGVSVTVIESDMIGNGGSCRNGGGVRVSGRDPRELEICAYGVKNIWPTLSEELGIDVEYRQKGYLVCGYDDSHRKLIKDRINAAAKFGIKMELKEESEIRELYPYVSEHVTCAGWTPTDGVANPLKTTLGFYIRARQNGAKFITGEKVLRIEKVKGRARRAISESGNIYEAQNIILACGYGGREILNSVGIEVLMQKKLEEVVVTEPAPKLFDHMIGGMSGFYGQQTKHGSFVFGSSCGREEYLFNKNNTISTYSSPSFICDTLGEDIPALKKLKIVHTWSGWIDRSLDAVPIIGNIEEVDGLYVSIASSGHGFGPGPAIGYILSELVQGRPSPVDIGKLHYDRFDYIKYQDRYFVSDIGGSFS